MITITPIATGVAGEASHLCVQTFNASEIMTAMKNGSGNLELIGWLVKNGDQLTRPQLTRPKGSTATAGAVQEVALTLVGRTAVTAVRDGSGHLLLISWNVPHNLTSVDRLHDSGTHAGEASQIAMTAIGNILVTALRAGDGHLLLISWALNSDGSFTRRGDSGSQAGEVSLVKIASIGNGIVVTAVRNGSGKLELIGWKISADGATIHRQNPSGTTAGAVGEISLIASRTDPQTGARGVITAVQNGAGKLEVIGWRIQDDGATIVPSGTTNTLPPAQIPGAATHIGIGLGGGATTYVASMRRGSGDLELIAFDMTPNGGWKREGEFVQGSGTDVTETAITSGAVTASRKANFLNVGLWEVSLG